MKAAKKDQKPNIITKPSEKAKSKTDDVSRSAKNASEDTKKAGKKKSDSKENHVKKAKSAYNCFCEELRPKVMADIPDIKPKDVLKELGARWKATSDDARKKYQDLAAKDKERYNKEMAKEGGGDEKKGAGKKKDEPKKAVNTKKGSRSKKETDEDEDEDSD